uniref:Erythroid differentiation-related factor 1 n=1 Tax=Anisakis simplex TaxID=6269 RepID=A0A0M3K939_ANISI
LLSVSLPLSLSPNSPVIPAIKLAPNTNLNVPPLKAWFNNDHSSTYPNGRFGFSSHQKDCFHSLRLANKYTDSIGSVDVISHSDTIKKLLLSPFNANQPLNMFVHRIGKTILIDNCEYLRTAYMNNNFNNKSTSPVANFLKLQYSKHIGISSESTSPSQNSQLATNDIINRLGERMITENLYSRSLALMDHQAEGLDEAKVNVKSSKNINKASSKTNVSAESGFTDPLEDYGITGFQDVDEVDVEIEGRVWKFENLRMLVDVNIPIFGCNTNPCVTIYAKDMKQRPISCLTGIDLYLDQCMCNVPEALLCWHMAGYVKEYEVIRTEDIPKLDNSKFDPNVLKNIAENLVDFLNEHATQEGHTYWLSRDVMNGNEGMLRLWDLTPLCADLLEDEISNPYTLSVAVLIYKVARNLMRRSATTRPKRIANAIYRLLHVCLAIIDKNKYPQIVACARYLLANLYLSYGHDALKRSDEDENEIEKNEPTWAYDDQWQREYGQTYEHYAAISIESLKKKSLEESNGEKPPPKLRSLPNCSSIIDCYKQALEHCYEGLVSLDKFDQLEENRERKNRMSFTKDRVNLADTYEEIGEMLKRDVRSILFIRAATAYNLLADNAFVLERYGCTIRFARVALLCCLAVKKMNEHCKRPNNRDEIKQKNALRNYTTASSLIPVIYTQCAANLTLFPPTASAILPVCELAKRCGSVNNMFGMRAIKQIQSYLTKVTPSDADNELAKAAIAQFLAIEHGVQSATTMTSEAICRRIFAIAKNYFLQAYSMFDMSSDNFNKARMLGNLGQLHYLMMNCIAVTTDSSGDSLYRKERPFAVEAKRYYETAYEAASKNRQLGDNEFYEHICKDFGNVCCLFATIIQEKSTDFLKIGRECEEYLWRAIRVYEDAIEWEGCGAEMRVFFIRKTIEALYRSNRTKREMFNNGTIENDRKICERTDERDVVMRAGEDLYGYVVWKVIDILRALVKDSYRNTVQLRMENADEWKEFYRELLFEDDLGIYESLTKLVGALQRGVDRLKLF